MTQPTITQPPPPIAGTDWVPPGWAPPTAPPPPVPPTKQKIGRYIVGAVVLFFIGAGIVGAAAGGKRDTASSDGVITTPTTASTTRSTTNVAAAAHLSVPAWASRYGSSDAEQLGDDLSALQADAEAMDLSSMGSSCRTMQRHVATAASHLPTPDAQLTSALRETYGYYGQAMTACISGTANMDADTLTEMSSYISLATSSIQRATARIEALS